MTGQQLRNSILQEAIQGHLVPQIATEEPAIKLLERIHREKGELAKAGKIKKADLFVEPISEDECPFEKPSGWEFARLSELSLDSADGPFGSNLKKEHYTDKKQVRIIQLSNIGELGWRDSNVKYTTFEHLKTVGRSEAFAGDIIIAKMMPAGRAIICPNTDIKYVLSSDAVRFAFSTLLDRRYLYYAINSPVFKDQVYGEVQGITRVRTSLSKLRTYILPIPPLSEQKRIVERIDELLPLVDEYDKANVELEALNRILPEKLRKSVLQEAIRGNLVPNDIPDGEASASELLQQILKERQEKENKEKGKKAKKLTLSTIEEEPWELPEGWCWCYLDEIVHPDCPISYGIVQPGDNVSGGVPVVRPVDMSHPVVMLKGLKRVSEGISNSYKRTILQGGELLICVRGTTGLLATASSELGGGNVTRGIVPLFFPDNIDKEYVRYTLSAPMTQKVISELTKGAALKQINIEDLRRITIPLPPLSIQHRIVERIEEVFSAIDKLQD